MLSPMTEQERCGYGPGVAALPGMLTAPQAPPVLSTFPTADPLTDPVVKVGTTEFFPR